jgi:hypothetical protein
MNPTTTQILTIASVAVGLIVLMRLIQPKLPIREQFLLKLIQAKSPQMDNIRLFMFLRMVIHPIETESDLDFQKRFLDEPETFKTICSQFKEFGAKALYPLLSFEALNWNLEVNSINPLVTRLAACQVCSRFPLTAEVVEELLAIAPDEVTNGWVSKTKHVLPAPELLKERYRTNLLNILRVIVTTKRNDWWPGTNPDIREWAEVLLAKYQ